MTGWRKALGSLWIRIAIGGTILILGAWWLADGLRGEERAEWASVERDDLVIGVEVEGTLRAVDTSSLGPPQIPWIWEYKISMMAPEGDEVKAGSPVVGFDTSELQRRLQEKIAESEEAKKEIERKEAELTQKRQEAELRLAEAEANKRKASLKVEVPGGLASENDLRASKLDLELAKKEIAFLEKKLEGTKRSGEASLRVLRRRKERAEERVREYRDAIESMSVKAPRDGTVIYVSNWRDEKKKVGESCWRGEKVLEIPDLKRMMANGEVDEADASHVAVGQKLTLRLDAHPDDEFTGKVAFIWETVQQKSWRNSLKVVRLKIDMDETDVRRMRPGMRFRGSIETERIEKALTIPSESVFLMEEGPVVYRKTFLKFEKVPVVLGRRNEKAVEVLEGLRENDRISRRDLSVS